MPHRRRSFRPLELSIYMPGRTLSPLPDFEVEDWNKPVALQKPEAAMVYDSHRPEGLTRGYTDSVISTRSISIRRKPLSMGSDLGSHQRFGSYASASTSILDEGFIPGSDFPLQDLSSEAASNVIQQLPAVKRSDSRYGRPRTSSSSTSGRSRSNTPSSTSRKPSFRRTKTDVDEAIQELNTIVEEKRIDAIRAASRNDSLRLSSKLSSPGLKISTQDGEVSPGLPSPHVPAIVPKMKVHARSETLSDIGSAFSTPLIGKPLPTPPPEAIPTMTVSEESLQPVKPRLSLFPVPTSRSVTALSPVSPPTAVSARTKISSWLRKSLTASLHSASENAGPDYFSDSYNNHLKGDGDNDSSPFYKLKPPVIQYEDGYATSTSTLSSYVPSPLEASPSNLSFDTSAAGTALTSVASPSPLGHDRRPSANKLPFAAHVKEREKSKAAQVARARGLSVGTVSGVPPPPAYEVVDPHPSTPESPAVVGLAF